jgi:hypothetical protein
LRGKAAVNRSHSKRFAKFEDARQSRQRLDCGGRAQRRHRFGGSSNVVKAAWRFASRRTPKFDSSFDASKFKQKNPLGRAGLEMF